MIGKKAIFAEQLAGAQFDLYAFISVLMGGAAEAEDVLQETNFEMLTHEEKYDPSRPFMFWARGVARHCVLRFYRTRGRDKLVFDEELMDSLADEIPCVTDERPLEDLMRLEQCLKRLVPKQREVITAHYMRGEPVKDVATHENCSEGSMSVWLFRIRRLLADCISKKRREIGGTV
jgi:RNA polymerase sigma-70 factor (ECF subfamily)